MIVYVEIPSYDLPRWIYSERKREPRIPSSIEDRDLPTSVPNETMGAGCIHELTYDMAVGCNGTWVSRNAVWRRRKSRKVSVRLS